MEGGEGEGEIAAQFQEEKEKMQMGREEEVDGCTQLVLQSFQWQNPLQTS